MVSYITIGKGPSLAAANISCLVISWIFSPVRVYVKLRISKMWHLEDWCFVGAQLLFTALALTSLESAYSGNGQKLATIASEDIPKAMKLWFVCELLQIATTALMRLCLGILLASIGTSKAYVYTIYATMAMMSVNTMTSFFLTIFQCSPIDYFWLQFSGLSGECLPAILVQDLSIVSAAIMALVDLIFGILPIFLIWNLKINRKAKLIAGFLLAIGIVAGATVIMRIKFIRDVSLTQDFLFAISNVVVWSMIEPCIGICCLSIVTFRPLFRSLSDQTTSRSKYVHGYKDGETSTEPVVRRDGGVTAFSRGSRPSKSSWQMMSVQNDSNSESLPLEEMKKNVHTISERDTEEVQDYSREDKGIYMARTVEITREERLKDIV
ncbi:hypothetical protein BJ878DRAFT_7897 [Calycina marina]|uniref:Rhodopsin domain-containing protein n=1 Tax=Calycina marina TaxID=1763456 RepID=A0A9P8CGD9_9HELO|nr:hypothetical protein BJ878DRAFT_7897 [Calycina marina]